MTPETLLAALLDADAMFPLLGSVVAGALIGVDREFQGKSAGLRTHTLVCFASALMTLLSARMAEWAVALPEGTQIVSDMARMPHAILTGIGFLGAGVIFRSRLSVQGLTTAASLWVTASIGIVFGAGMLELAIISTAIALAVLILLRASRYFSPPQPIARISVAVTEPSGFTARRLSSLLADAGLRPGPVTVRHDRTAGTRSYDLLVSAHHPRIDAEAIMQRLAEEPEAHRIAVVPLANEHG